MHGYSQVGLTLMLSRWYLPVSSPHLIYDSGVYYWTYPAMFLAFPENRPHKLSGRSIFPAEGKNHKLSSLPRFYLPLQENWGKTKNFKGKHEQNVVQMLLRALSSWSPRESFLEGRSFAILSLPPPVSQQNGSERKVRATAMSRSIRFCWFSSLMSEPICETGT